MASVFVLGVVFPAERIAHAAPVPFQLPIEPGVIDPVVPVGRLVGTVAVNPAGSAIYTMPLDLPATRGDLMPPLALVNSPDAGPGQYGYGWSVSGISVIDQCHVANGEYAYCLDGTPLVQVPNEQRSFDCHDGDPDCISKLEEYRTYPDTGLRVSRTQEPYVLGPDGVLPVVPSRWKVEFPSGRTSHYQDCIGTCIESMISGPHGNYVTINAHHDERRGVILEEIHYEGNLATGEPPTGVVRFHDNGIEFDGRYYWFDRTPYDPCEPDEASGPNGCAPTTSGKDGAGGYQLLSSVTACAGDFPADGAGPGAECIPPTRFQYTKRPDRLEWKGFDHNTSIPADPCHGPFFGDFDGDGKTDAIWGAESCHDEKLRFWANGSESWEIESIAEVPADVELLVDDIDGDGSQDIVYFDAQAEVHTISALGGVPQYRTYAAAHAPGEFFQPVLADLNSDGVMDIVSCEGPAKAKVTAEKFPTNANRIYVYLGEVDNQGHRLAPPTSSLFDPVAEDGSLTGWKTEGKFNEVGCEPGPTQVRHGFGGDIVIFGRTGYFAGKNPTDIWDVRKQQALETDIIAVDREHEWLSSSDADQAPMPRAIQLVENILLERLPVRDPWHTGSDWDWNNDWPTTGVIPVSGHDGAGRRLEFSAITGHLSLRQRRLRYFVDSFASPDTSDTSGLPWVPETTSSAEDTFFPFNTTNSGWTVTFDTDGDGVDDGISYALLRSFFFDWNADGSNDYAHQVNDSIFIFAQDPNTESFADFPDAIETGIPDKTGSRDTPFPAQDDDDAELEIWQETDWGSGSLPDPNS